MRGRQGATTTHATRQKAPTQQFVVARTTWSRLRSTSTRRRSPTGNLSAETMLPAKHKGMTSTTSETFQKEQVSHLAAARSHPPRTSRQTDIPKNMYLILRLLRGLLGGGGGGGHSKKTSTSPCDLRPLIRLELRLSGHSKKQVPHLATASWSPNER